MRAAILIAMMAASSHTSAVEKWRADYEADLKAPGGWLSVAGLSWLHDGVNGLPEGLPADAGTLVLEDGKVRYQPRSGPSIVLKPDSDDAARIGEASISIIARGGKFGVRLRDPNAAARRNFAGCAWFPISEAWDVRARWVAYPEPKRIPILNVLGMTDEEISPGYAEFTVLGKTLRLEPVIEDDQLFFMLKDATSGKSTYPAGRFLYAAMPKDGAVELDFNKARNPPCAFTAFATCPLPPKQNFLPIAVEAGEKTYGQH
ncbi:MAG: DUF1684 domain-containing protein [Acidobacteriota bacterium]|nr:DUF1684 domain-containing protein [Acidobacteriota bacterium]